MGIIVFYHNKKIRNNFNRSVLGTGVISDGLSTQASPRQPIPVEIHTYGPVPYPVRGKRVFLETLCWDSTTKCGRLKEVLFFFKFLLPSETSLKEKA